MNVDGFCLSGYYYKHRVDSNQGKIGAGPILDFDRSMGSADGRDDNPSQWDGTDDSSRVWSDDRCPWWGHALNNPDFRQALTGLWQKLRRTESATTPQVWVERPPTAILKNGTRAEIFGQRLMS
jgi:hypothetical protein